MPLSGSRFRRAAVVAATVPLALACPQERAPLAPLFEVGASPAAVLIGVGDVSSCSHDNVAATAALLDTIDGAVALVGDAVAPSGAPADYANCYDPKWGRHKARTYPTPGELDYLTPGAAGYFGYFGSQLAQFGAQALDSARGYYSLDLGSWHVVVLNSSVPTAAGSPQEQWLKADLAAHPTACTLAYWHLPRFYSGWSATERASVKPLWSDLYAAGAEVVLNAHTRHYERFAPQDANGAPDSLYGIGEFVVATGGLGRWGFGTTAPNSAVRAQELGVLKLTLYPTGYTWRFISVTNTSFADSGAGSCHGPPALPSVDAGPNLRVKPGASMQLRFRAADPNGAGPWRYLIDWGDGSTHRRSDGTLGLVAVRHVYRSAGQYLVSVTATDQADRSGSDTLTVFVEPKDAPQVFVGAGDVGTCAKGYPLATGRLLDTIPGTVFLLGDDAYPDGSDSSDRRCFQPGWGRHRKRIHPVPGNHDYKTPGAAGYFRYFGVAAGDPATGYYSYDLGAWHVVALNSNLDMRAGSAQEQWLRADLAAHPARCTLAYWHIPRFSSGTSHGSSTLPQPLWQALHDYGAELVLVGHEHNYERFAPQTPDGTLDPGRGIRQFVVGTGGAGSYPFGTPLLNSEVRTWTHGVLKLTLADGSYTWEFVPVAGQTFRDSGTGSCH